MNNCELTTAPFASNSVGAVAIAVASPINCDICFLIDSGTLYMSTCASESNLAACWKLPSTKCSNALFNLSISSFVLTSTGLDTSVRSNSLNLTFKCSAYMR